MGTVEGRTCGPRVGWEGKREAHNGMYKESISPKPGKMHNVLQTYKLPKLRQEEIENWNKLIISKEIESVFKKTPKNTEPNGFTCDFYQTFKE